MRMRSWSRLSSDDNRCGGYNYLCSVTLFGVYVRATSMVITGTRSGDFGFRTSTESNQQLGKLILVTIESDTRH